MVRLAFARLPSEGEKKIAMDFLTESASTNEGGRIPVAAWADFAHSLINTKEFIFLP
jgi:hypothetical protein